MALARTLLTLAVFVSSCQSVPTSLDCYIETLKGPVEGYKMETHGKKTICAYEGLPYAKPPTQERRFKPPVEIEAFTDMFYANSTPEMCPQNLGLSTHVQGDEDCLYYNVFTPQVGYCKARNLYPVIVFINTWQYVSGNSVDINRISPHFLLDQPVVFVAVNFRLGALGFLSTGDHTVRGNWGIKDVALAVQRISLNAARFGGDKDKITVLGHAQGAVIAQLLFYVTKTTGLINNAIMQSGCVSNPYSLAPLPLVTGASEKLAELVECPTNTSKALLECMQKKSLEEIVGNQLLVYPNSDALTGNLGLWAPVLERPYSTDVAVAFNPATLPACCKHKYSILTGVSAYDGGVFTAHVLDRKSGLMEQLNNNRISTLINLLQLNVRFCEEQLRLVAAEIDQHYFKGRYIHQASESKLTNMFNDWFYFTGLRRTTLGQVGNRFVYFYNTTMSPSFNQINSGNLTLTPTLGDVLLTYLPYAARFPDRKYTAAELKIIKFSVQTMVNFATHGKPNAGLKIDWNPVRNTGKINYLYLANNGSVEQHDDFNPSGVQFMESLLHKYPCDPYPLADLGTC